MTTTRRQAEGFEPIGTMKDARRAARQGELYYWAPLDYRPVWARARAKRDGTILIVPPPEDADAFTADQHHVERFYRKAK